LAAQVGFATCLGESDIRAIEGSDMQMMFPPYLRVNDDEEMQGGRDLFCGECLSAEERET
jgi:hypothetical protein